MLHLNWKGHREDVPDVEEPNEVFAMLCYRGIHYAKWVLINPFISEEWLLKNPRESEWLSFFMSKSADTLDILQIRCDNKYQ